MAEYCRNIESDLAMDECCCGTPKTAAPFEKKLKEANQLHNVMLARSKAKGPRDMEAIPKPPDLALFVISTQDGLVIVPRAFMELAGGSGGGATATTAGSLEVVRTLPSTIVMPDDGTGGVLEIA